MIRTLQFEHHELVTERPFEEVLAAFNAATGSVEEGFAPLAEACADKAEFEALFKQREGSSGFMRFMVTDHGSWLSRFYDLPRKAVMIVLGNPLIAISMLQPSLGAGLNVPTRIFIFEGPDGRTHVTYDLPSTLMADLSDETKAAARNLDAKLVALAERIVGA